MEGQQQDQQSSNQGYSSHGPSNYSPYSSGPPLPPYGHSQGDISYYYGPNYATPNQMPNAQRPPPPLPHFPPPPHPPPPHYASKVPFYNEGYPPRTSSYTSHSPSPSSQYHDSNRGAIENNTYSEHRMDQPPYQYGQSNTNSSGFVNMNYSGLNNTRIIQDSEIKDSKSEDQDWVNKWIDKNKINHRLKAQSETESNISIPEAKQLFREAMQISEFLQNAQKDLKDELNSPGEVWEKLWSDVQRQKARLEEIKQILNRPTVTALSLKNLKIQAKRERSKKSRTKARREKLERRDRLHREIDEKLARIWKKAEDDKKDREVKKAADEILAEVRRKISEAQKAVDLIKALTKLRQLRRDVTERKGLYVPKEIESKFGEKTKVLSAMLDEQLQTYNAEKRTLEALLQQEAEETAAKELVEKRKQINELERRKEKTIRRLLFGRDVHPDPDDPMVPFRQYYEVADRSIDALMQIRREWDLYLVPPCSGGTRIPEGWIIPPEPSSNIWASALK